MNEREKEIVRLALNFLSANLNDLNELFPAADGDDTQMDYNGDTIDTPTESEIEQLCKVFQ